MPTVQCPSCGGREQLSDEQFANVSTRGTVCLCCGKTFRPNDSPDGSPQTLSYESSHPSASASGGSCRRVVSGKKQWLLIRDGGSTPDRCVDCNAPADGYRKRCKWAEGTSTGGGGGDGIIGTILLVLELVALVAHLSTRKSGHVFFAMCPKCRRRRRRLAWLAGLLCLVGAVGLVMCIVEATRSVWHGASWHRYAVHGIIASAVILGTSLAVALSASFQPGLDRISGKELWFKHVGRKFMDSLPATEEHSTKGKSRE